MKKMRLKEKLLILFIGMVFCVAQTGRGEMSLKAQAAEPIVITSLVVETTFDRQGVIAKCSYQNYSALSGCEMRLYLYRQEDSGISVIAQKALAYADQGNESINPVQVSEGIYLASVTMDYGTELRQINSRDYYRVKIVDGNYVVTEEPIEGQVNGEQTQYGLTCDHMMEYYITQEATPIRNSVLAYQCMRCGEVLEYIEVPNSAYSTFLKETADAVLHARSSEVTINTDRWMSFNRDVFEAIKSRPDVTVTVNYRYQGEMYHVTLPAGTDVDLFIDENGFCGFRYMDEVLAH